MSRKPPNLLAAALHPGAADSPALLTGRPAEFAGLHEPRQLVHSDHSQLVLPPADQTPRPPNLGVGALSLALFPVHSLLLSLPHCPLPHTSNLITTCHIASPSHPISTAFLHPIRSIDRHPLPTPILHPNRTSDRIHTPSPTTGTLLSRYRIDFLRPCLSHCHPYTIIEDPREKRTGRCFSLDSTVREVPSAANRDACSRAPKSGDHQRTLPSNPTSTTSTTFNLP